MSSVLDEVDGIETAPDVLSVLAGTTPAFLLALDIGTSGIRAALFDERGKELSGLGLSTQRNTAAFSDLGVLDADTLVNQVFETIDDLLAVAVGNASQIRFIAISCFWHSLIGVDSNFQPTTPLLGWADTRAAQSAIFLRSSFDEQEFHGRTGCRFHASYWPAKLHWLWDKQRDICERTTGWLGFSEYLCQKLFDSASISVSMASATGLMDQRTCDWDWKFIEALKVSPQSIPNIAGDDHHPQLRAEFADRWPALSESRLMTVVGDGAANNFGSGCCTKDRFALMVGTSGAMRVVYEGSPPTHLPLELWSYRVDRSRVVVGGALSDGGGLYRWLTDLMCIGEDPVELENRLAALGPDTHGLTILPFWSGERSTGWSGSARGAILGLTQQTKPFEIVRAALEAIAYRFALIAKALEGVAGNATIVATGNALSSSRVWSQIIADVLGKPLVLCDTREASTRGAALLALQSLGKIQNLENASLEIDEVVEPDLMRHARYLEGLERQQHMYECLVTRL